MPLGGTWLLASVPVQGNSPPPAASASGRGSCRSWRREERAPGDAVLAEQVAEHGHRRQQVRRQDRKEEYLETDEQHEEREQEPRLSIRQRQKPGRQPAEDHEGRPVDESVF